MKSKLKKFTEKLEKETEKIRRIIETMPYRGNTSEESQKVNLTMHLNKLEACINGIEEEDLQELSY